MTIQPLNATAQANKTADKVADNFMGNPQY